jgi:hypothetical protein
VCITALGVGIFAVFLVAYAFFMPVWLVAEPRFGNGVGGHSPIIRISEESQLDKLPALQKIISETSVPQSEEDRQATIVAASQQEWADIMAQYNIEGQNFVLQYGDKIIDVRVVWSFFPP